MASCSYMMAKEVKTLASEIILSKFPTLEHKPIRYMFRDKPRKIKGELAIATAEVVTGREALLSSGKLSGYDMADITGFQEPEMHSYGLVEVCHPYWVKMTPEEREFVLNHELLHFGTDDEGNLITVGHDIELFFRDAAFLGQSVVEFKEQFCRIDELHRRITAPEPKPEKMQGQEKMDL